MVYITGTHKNTIQVEEIHGINLNYDYTEVYIKSPIKVSICRKSSFETLGGKLPKLKTYGYFVSKGSPVLDF